MPSRPALAWLLLFVFALAAACAADYAVFAWRQRHGDVLSFVTVNQYQAVNLGGGNYRYEYFGKVDVPCTQTLLRHQNLPPCWYVTVNQENWKW